MPILDIQTRARELGRIRIGQVVKSGGKTRPEKMDKFRFTCHSKELLDQVAALFGGTVREWQPHGGGAKAWELLSDAKRVPILVPPQPVSQWYELWSGGGCQRRCDGTTNVITDEPCVCLPKMEDNGERECKPTTRLNVMLRDVPGLGVWRLESHGYNAAVELPAVAEFLAQARGYVPASLVLEERVSKKNNQTRRYMVPAIEVELITPAQLMAGGTTGLQPGVIEAKPVAAIEASHGPDWVAMVGDATTREELLGILADAKEAGVDGGMAKLIEQRMVTRAQELGITKPAEPEPVESADDLWIKVLSSAPPGWTSEDVEIDFQKITGVDPAEASAADMRRYIDRERAA